MGRASNYGKKVLAVLEQSSIALSVEGVRSRTGIKSWLTAKAVLLELVATGQAEGIRTDKSWAFASRGAIKAIQAPQKFGIEAVAPQE